MPSKAAAPASSASSSSSHTSRSTSPAGVDPEFAHAGHTITDASSEYRQEQQRRHIEAIAAKLEGLRDPSNPSKLTPLRAHYLKKALVKLQVEKEVQQLSKQDALSTFGPPFKPSAAARTTDLPLARFIFHHFVLTFPFLRSAPPNFFADKVQVFVESFLQRNISGTDDRAEETKRRKLTNRLENSITVLMATAIRVGGEVGGEEIVKITPQDRARLNAAQTRLKAALAGNPFQRGDATFDVNVVGVRTVVQKGRLRSRVHEQFLIRTRRPNQPDVFVSRRYGDFERLADTLRLEFPDEDISKPPPKDRSNIEANGAIQNAQNRADAEGQAYSQSMENLTLQEPKPLPARPSGSVSASATPEKTSLDSPVRGLQLPSGPLNREKNRLTLRAYVRTLLAIPSVADSPALADFLLGEPTTLAPAEEADVRSREALDAIRLEEATRFNNEASMRVAQLQEHLSVFKKDLVQRDGLSRVFGTIKSTPRMEDLPESYRALLAWARISSAATLYHLFMGSDNSSDLFSQLKRIHGLMPYFMMRQILRISNPVTMIRGVIDLFLARPFGGQSLLQRMFSSSLQEEARELSEMITAVKSKVEDETLCEKVRLFVYAPHELQSIYRSDAEQERVDLMTVILRSPEEPRLAREQIHRVIRASRSYEVYKKYRAGLKHADMDQGPQDDDAWLYEDLHVLLRLMTRLRDKEQMLSLIFEGVTADLLKDIVTIFYSPLAQVYKAANIADSLYDFQAFLNDLIKTVEANEELSYTDPQKTVQVFIDLVARHEGKFYAFVHQVHSKGAGLFDGLMHWIELFLNFVRSGDPKDSSTHQGEEQNRPQRQGLGEIDLEFVLPAGGTDRSKVLAEVDALVVYAYRMKMLREIKLSRRIADREVQGAGNSADVGFKGPGSTAEDDEGAFLNTMVDNLGMGNQLTEEIEDVESDEEEEEDEEEDEEETQGEIKGDKGSQSPDYYDSESELSDSDAEWVADPSSPSRAHPPSSDNVKPWRPPAATRGDSVLTITGLSTPVVEKDLPSLPFGPSAHQRTADEEGAAPKKRTRSSKPKPPELKAIPEMVPVFVEILRPMLRPARSASATSLRAPLAGVSGTGTGAGAGAGALGEGEGGNEASQSTRTTSSGQTAAAAPGGWFWQ